MAPSAPRMALGDMGVFYIIRGALPKAERYCPGYSLPSMSARSPLRREVPRPLTFLRSAPDERDSTGEPKAHGWPRKRSHRARRNPHYNLEPCFTSISAGVPRPSLHHTRIEPNIGPAGGKNSPGFGRGRLRLPVDPGGIGS